MTSPFQHGYPDWGRQQATADIGVLDESGVNLTAPTTYGPFLVAGLPYLAVECNSAQSMEVTLDWYTDSSLTQYISGDTIVTPAGGIAYVTLPVVGNYVRFNVERGAYPGTVTVRASMTANPSSETASGGATNNLLEVDGLTVNAGVTNTYNSTNIRGGWARWDATLILGVVYLVRLYAVDFAGGLTLIGVIDSNTGRGGGMIFVPAMPLRMLFSNFDGANKTAYAFVTHHPFDT